MHVSRWFKWPSFFRTSMLSFQWGWVLSFQWGGCCSFNEVGVVLLMRWVLSFQWECAVLSMRVSVVLSRVSVVLSMRVSVVLSMRMSVVLSMRVSVVLSMRVWYWHPLFPILMSTLVTVFQRLVRPPPRLSILATRLVSLNLSSNALIDADGLCDCAYPVSGLLSDCCNNTIFEGVALTMYFVPPLIAWYQSYDCKDFPTPWKISGTEGNMNKPWIPIIFVTYFPVLHFTFQSLTSLDISSNFVSELHSDFFLSFPSLKVWRRCPNIRAGFHNYEFIEYWEYLLFGPVWSWCGLLFGIGTSSHGFLIIIHSSFISYLNLLIGKSINIFYRIGVRLFWLNRQ